MTTADRQRQVDDEQRLFSGVGQRSANSADRVHGGLSRDVDDDVGAGGGSEPPTVALVEQVDCVCSRLCMAEPMLVPASVGHVASWAPPGVPERLPRSAAVVSAISALSRRQPSDKSSTRAASSNRSNVHRNCLHRRSRLPGRDRIGWRLGRRAERDSARRDIGVRSGTQVRTEVIISGDPRIGTLHGTGSQGRGDIDEGDGEESGADLPTSTCAANSMSPTRIRFQDSSTPSAATQPSVLVSCLPGIMPVGPDCR